jgi:hypothetical protein
MLARALSALFRSAKPVMDGRRDDVDNLRQICLKLPKVWLTREMELDWVWVEGVYPDMLELSCTAPSCSASRRESGRVLWSGENVCEAVRFMSECCVDDTRSSRADEVLGRCGRREEARRERVIEAARALDGALYWMRYPV